MIVGNIRETWQFLKTVATLSFPQPFEYWARSSIGSRELCWLASFIVHIFMINSPVVQETNLWYSCCTFRPHLPLILIFCGNDLQSTSMWNHFVHAPFCLSFFHPHLSSLLSSTITHFVPSFFPHHFSYLISYAEINVIVCGSQEIQLHCNHFSDTPFVVWRWVVVDPIPKKKK